MRKLSVFLAVVSLSALGLTGCSLPGAAQACPQPTAESSVLDTVTVSGSASAKPRVDVYTPFHVEESAWSEVTSGEGTQIGDEDQLVVLDIAVVSGDSGDETVATLYDGSLTNVIPLSQWAQTFPVLPDALRCASAGSRVVIATSPDDLPDEAVAGLGLGADESAVVVVDVRKVYLDRADGSNVFNTGHGLPTVVRDPQGRPGVIVPDGEAPAESVVQTIKRGSGETVAADDAVRVHYTAVNWDEKEVTQSTWDSTPVAVTAGVVSDPTSEALVGQTVGSQIMVVVPADEASGTGAMVFVIDVLGIDASASE